MINADDFGLTPGVNQSILDLNRGTALTSTTLMANASHAVEAAAGATECGKLGVGCHVVLVDGDPILARSNITSLTLPSGKFRSGLGKFAFDLMRGAISEAEIELEATAQIRRIQSLGIKVTHLDTHKHTHMFPGVLRPLLRAAVSCGVRAIRNPFEPHWALKATLGAPALRRMQVRWLRTQRRQFMGLVEQSGVATTDGAIGVLATGTLNPTTLESLMEAMPAGTWELVCHPGYVSEELNKVRTRLRESRRTEHEALAEFIPGFLSRHPEVEPVNFGQVAGRMNGMPIKF